MLTYFKVEPEEPFDNYVIEDDIDEFIFLNSNMERRSLAGKKMRVYMAEYMMDNDKATVEVATVLNMDQAKRILKPWTLFEQNYTNYNDEHISIYVIDDEYYVMWMSNDTIVRIYFEDNEFPTDLVDEYLIKWPSTKINFSSQQLPGAQQPSQPGTTPATTGGCGDSSIRGSERCDPPGDQCIVEEFPIFEIEDQDHEYAGDTDDKISIYEIISDIVPAYAFIDVNGETKVMTENQLSKFELGGGYVHIYSILPDRVRLAFGYELGDCSEECRCIPLDIPVLQTCGNGEIDENLGEACDPTYDSECIARSGLLSECTNDCKCPEPLLGMTFCGDGLRQRPNDFGIMEMCDPPNFNPGSCAPPAGGMCTLTCQCILPGRLGNTTCGDGLVGPNEKCDPPGAACVTDDNKIGKCNQLCRCDKITEDVMNISELKKIICGKDDYECYGIGSSCEKEGRQGKCNADCECELSSCGNGVINAGEECDPPGSNQTIGNVITKICNANCEWEEVFSQEDAQKIEYCGTTEPECWPIDNTTQIDEKPMTCNGSCEWEIAPYCGDGNKDYGEECDYAESTVCAIEDEFGTCNESCKCEISAVCGDNKINEPEQCDPPNEPCYYTLTGYITLLPGMCDEDCLTCIPEETYTCTKEIEYFEKEEVMNAYNLCKSGDCPKMFLNENCEITIETKYPSRVLVVSFVEFPIKIRYTISGGVPVEKCFTGSEEIPGSDKNKGNEEDGGDSPAGALFIQPGSINTTEGVSLFAILFVIFSIGGIIILNLVKKD